MRRSIILALSLFVAGCDRTEDDTANGGARPDTDVDTQECSDDDGCDQGQICEANACQDGDRDNSVEEASALLWETEMSGVINPAGDVDWYAIEAEGGEFIRASVTTEEIDGGLDSVLSIYTPAGKLLSWEDEHPGGGISGIDSVVYAYFPEAGTYHLKVEDKGSFYEDGDPVGGPDETYSVIVYELGDGGDEPDSAQNAGTTYDDVSPNIWYSIPVLISEAGDADFTRIVLPEAGTPVFLLAGMHNEESVLEPQLTVYNQAGDVVNSLAGPTAEDPARLPEPEGTSYVVEVSDAAGGGGPEDWGWLFFIVREVGSGNPSGGEPHDDLATAEELDLEDQEPDSGRWYAGFRQGSIGVDDADVYAFSVPFDDAYVTVSLGAQTYGSLLTARLELLDEAGTVLETVDSTVAGDESAVNLGPYASGDYFLRISSVDEGVGGEGYFYLFGAHATSFQFD